ncbi:MAG: 50S ribosomal protein L9 [Candidatus Gracilibacteria bacterium]|jgi:large subunit ribosomal protein L9
MKVLLTKDVSKLGYRGDIVNVKDGYFRNFLQINKLAEIATSDLLALAESRKEKVLMEKKRVLDNAKDVLKRLKGLVIKFKKKVTSKGKLYGAVIEEDVLKAILDAVNIKLEKEYIKMSPIKEAGTFDITVHLGEKLEENVKIEITAE